MLLLGLIKIESDRDRVPAFLCGAENFDFGYLVVLARPVGRTFRGQRAVESSFYGALGLGGTISSEVPSGAVKTRMPQSYFRSDRSGDVDQQGAKRVFEDVWVRFMRGDPYCDCVTPKSPVILLP